MNTINYLKGDLFVPVLALKETKIIIPHVVNNKGVFAAGFVVPLARHFPKVKKDYLAWASDPEYHPAFALGKTQFVRDTDNLFIANMLAQTFDDKPRRLRYNALVKCMETVAEPQGFEIHAPLFGSSLAGGNWWFIEELIKDIWLERNLKVNIYYLPEQLPLTLANYLEGRFNENRK